MRCFTWNAQWTVKLVSCAVLCCAVLLTQKAMFRTKPSSAETYHMMYWIALLHNDNVHKVLQPTNVRNKTTMILHAAPSGVGKCRAYLVNSLCMQECSYTCTFPSRCRLACRCTSACGCTTACRRKNCMQMCYAS